MAIDSDIRDQAYHFFVIEAEEHLILIESELLTLKEDRNPAKVHSIMRAAHSIKGGSAAVGLPTIKTIAHKLEDIFKALHNEEIIIDDELELLLLQAYDRLRIPLQEQLTNGSFDEEKALAEAEPIFEQIGERLAGFETQEEYLPSAAELGIDIAESIFEVDVEQELKTLEDVVENPQNHHIIGELHALTEVFTGIGELLVLPGLISINQAVLNALKHNSEQALEIATLALADYRKAQQDVLNGDRTQGGSPSPALLKLANLADQVNNPTLDDIFAGEEITDLPSDNQDENNQLDSIFTDINNQDLGDVFSEPIQEISEKYDNLELDNSWAIDVNYTAEPLSPQSEEIGENNENLALDDSWIIQEKTEENTVEILENQADFPLDDSWIIQEKTEENTVEILENQADFPLDDSWIIQEKTEENAVEILENQADFPLDDSWIIQEKTEENAAKILEKNEDLALDNSWGIDVNTPDILSPQLENVGENFENLALDNSWITPEQTVVQTISETGESLILDNSWIINVDDTPQKVLKEDDLTPLIPLDDEILTEKQSKPNNQIIPLNLEDKIPTVNDELEDIFAHIESPLLSGEEQFIPLDLSQNVLSEQEQEIKEIIDINIFEKSSNNQESLSLENVFGEFNPTQEKIEEIIPIYPSDHNSLSLEDVFADFTETEENAGEIDSEKTELMIPQPLAKKQIVEEKKEIIIPETIVKKPIIEEKTPPPVKEQKTEIVTPTVKKPIIEEKTQPKIKETAKETEIKQVVKSIEKAFSSLPVAENITPPKLTNETAKVSENKSAEKQNEPSNLAPQLSVRVDLERLERMNNLVGELAINRNGLSLQNEQLQATVKELLKRFNKFGDIASQLRILSDQMVVETKQQSLPQKTAEKLPEITEEEELIIGSFDDLEMDSYGALNSLLQYTLEEVVQLEEIVGDVGLLATQSTQTIESQRQKLNHLRDDLMWARMLPLGEVLSRFPRTLRELSNNYKKPVDLKLVGTGVLVDKAALEKLYDPLLHLLRNAFDHGIESPEIRKTQGKSERGQIEIKAYHQGSQTVIEMRDDGQGINLERIRKKAIELKLITLEDAAKTSTAKLLDLLFEPGFSTANKVSELSGRGVGLDVVRSQLRSLKGTVSVSSTPGKGTTFTMRIPLTLTIAKLLVCLVKSSAFALPSDSIEEIIIPQKEQINIHNQQRFLQWRKKIVPIYNLANLINYSVPLPDSLPSQALVAIPTPENWLPPILLIRQDHNFLGLEMDRLVTEQELVIKSFGTVLTPPSYIYGCTILGDGTLVPVIDTITLINNVMGESKHQLYSNAKSETITSINESENLPLTPNIPEPFVKKINQSPLILVVDDSITLRQTLVLTLQKANYMVVQARDGREAISQLQQNSHIQLVISDVEMPNMNGFEFLNQKRQDVSISKVPVIMLTSRSSDKHRKIAMHLGASAYFTKPYIEQEFLTAIKDIINNPNQSKSQLVEAKNG